MRGDAALRLWTQSHDRSLYEPVVCGKGIGCVWTRAAVGCVFDSSAL